MSSVNSRVFVISLPNFYAIIFMRIVIIIVGGIHHFGETMQRVSHLQVVLHWVESGREKQRPNRGGDERMNSRVGMGASDQ